MSIFFTILKRELKAVTRERTILIAVAIQLLIASFSSAILFGLMSLYDPEAVGLSSRIRLRVGIVGDFSDPLVEFLRQKNVQVTPFGTPEEASEAFREGRIEAAFLIPQHTVGGEGTKNIKLFLPESETLYTLILMVLRDPLRQYEGYLRAQNGVHLRFTDIEGRPSTLHEFRYGVILPLLMFFPAFVTGSMVIDSLSEELANRTLETLWSAPVSLNVIVGAKIAAPVVLAGGQCILWAMLLRANGIIIHNPALVVLMAIVSASIIGTLSTFIVLYFKDRERSHFVYSLFFLFSTSAGYMLDISPITVITRLATGDYYTGWANIAVYALALAGLLALLFLTSKRLLSMPA